MSIEGSSLRDSCYRDATSGGWYYGGDRPQQPALRGAVGEPQPKSSGSSLKRHERTSPDRPTVHTANPASQLIRPGTRTGESGTDAKHATVASAATTMATSGIQNNTSGSRGVRDD